MTIQPPVGTPDWQRGVVSPQKVIGAFVSGNPTETVGVPPNTETIWIIADNVSAIPVSHVVGVQSGVYYPVSAMPLVAGGGDIPIYVVPIAAALDSQVTIVWGANPGAWWVVADASVRQFIDTTLAGLITTGGGQANSTGFMVYGEYNGFAEPLATDSGGHLIPLVPTASSGVVTANSFSVATQVIAAPGSGALYLFGADITPNNGAANSGLDLITGGVTIAEAFGNLAANLGPTITVNLGGYRTTAAVFASPITTINARVVVRYALGP